MPSADETSKAPRLTARGHVSAEAYHVMRYEGEGGRREWLWNSRDGVTPFCIASRDGVEMQHGNWHLDRYEPFHVPAVGARIFVDMTEQLAELLATEYVKRHWDAAQFPMSAMWETQELAVKHFVKEWVADWGGHAPMIIEVTEVMHAQFATRAANRHL